MAVLEFSLLATTKPVVGSASPGLMSGKSGMLPASTVANSTLWMTIEITARTTAEVAASANMPETVALPGFETNLAGSFSGPSSTPSLVGTRPSRISL